MPATPERLLRLLADGDTHSGTDLATALGLTRAAVSKAARQLADLGVTIIAAKGRGYRLSEPLELLDADRIATALAPAARERLAGLELFWTTVSTNDCLLQAEWPPPDRARACLAEFQTGGRGRRGRPWFAQAGHGICLSLGWSFSSAPAQLGSLALAAGIAIRRAALRCGAQDVRLKWPNDVMAGDSKLAGILIDVRGEAGGPLQAIVGVGLNYRLAPGTAERVREAGGVTPATLTAAAGANCGRNAAAAAMIDALCEVLAEYTRVGFSALAAEWRDADYLAGRDVSVDLDGKACRGMGRGIAADGRLQLLTETGVMHVMSGDVSVRLETRGSSI